MNSIKVRLKAWIRRMLRPLARPVKRWAKPVYLRLRTGAAAVQTHYQVGKLLPILERTVENLRHEREQSDQFILALYQTLHYPPVAKKKKQAGQFSVALGANRLLVAHAYAPFILLDCDDLQTTPRIVMNQYESGVGVALRQLLRPGDLAVDIGAAPGVHTLTMATAVGPVGQVHALVHDFHEQQWLETNLRATGLNKIAHCHIDCDLMSLLPSLSRAPNLIRVKSYADHGSVLAALFHNRIPLTTRVLFSWPSEQILNPLGKALHELTLHFWKITPAGTLFRTTWNEMLSRASDQECYYVAGRGLE